MDNIIKKIVLDLGKKQVELTPEQCKKLKVALDEIFGKEVIKEIHHHDYWQWWPIPWYHDTIQSPIYPQYTTWYSDGCEVSYSNNTMTLKVA